MVLPGELNERVAPGRSPSAKYFEGTSVKLQNAAGLEVFHAQGGLAVEAGALIEVAVKIEQSLGVGLPVVGIGVDDLVGVGGEVTSVGAEGREISARRKGEKFMVDVFSLTVFDSGDTALSHPLCKVRTMDGAPSNLEYMRGLRSSSRRCRRRRRRGDCRRAGCRR